MYYKKLLQLEVRNVSIVRYGSDDVLNPAPEESKVFKIVDEADIG
ncbi:MAG: hypothetical protein RID53_33095 [Coleofasciculus sp. B1-GNL1-01]